MKMVINNKLEGNSELVGIKSSEKSSDIDALFAELFALVNLDSIDSEKNSFQELDAKEIDDKLNITDSNKNTMNVARSLAEVFYKELGIDNKSTSKKSTIDNVKNLDPREISFKDIKKSDLSNNLKNIVSLNESKKTIHFKNNPETNKNLDEQKVAKTPNFEIKIKKVAKINFENDIPKINPLNKTNKKLETDQLKNINSQTNTNRVKSSKETSIILKEKKISKKKNDSIITKADNEQEVVQSKINKESPRRVIGSLTQNTGKNSNETSLELKSSNNNRTKSLEKNLANNQNFNTKETLDLLESSWGEKFTKIIKNSIDRGISKLNFDLKPKNLGKISLEVTVKDSKTSIQISTESQEAANILNDNLPRLTDLIEEKNSKFSLFNEGNNHSNYFNQQKQKQDDRQETTVFKKKVNELKKIKTNNSIDVNA
jgi:flagellar hook-length control protein FliK